MSEYTGSACGKIILSGEYAVVFGYPGIAVPASVVSGKRLAVSIDFDKDLRKSEIEIVWPEAEGTPWIPYLKKIIELCKQHGFKKGGTLTITNSIPLNKGMGSSTALVIAVVRCLLSPPLPLKGEDTGEGLKKIALSIEDTVNPGHSGLDFEVIWNECPILFKKGKKSQSIVLDKSINRFIEDMHLIDTGKPNESTSELVKWVTSHKNDVRTIATLKMIGHCTEQLLEPRITESQLRNIFRAHHRAQVTLGVVPQTVQECIKEIEESGGYAKIIGAGGIKDGGGIVIAFGQNIDTIAYAYDYSTLNTQHCVH